jgi:hypothetical protein
MKLMRKRFTIAFKDETHLHISQEDTAMTSTLMLLHREAKELRMLRQLAATLPLLAGQVKIKAHAQLTAARLAKGVREEMEEIHQAMEMMMGLTAAVETNADVILLGDARGDETRPRRVITPPDHPDPPDHPFDAEETGMVAVAEVVAEVAATAEVVEVEMG